MKIAILGSRGLDVDVYAVLREKLPAGSVVEEIISGGAAGIDTSAERFADGFGIQKTVIKPDYEKHGRKAPLVRNIEMVDMADFVLLIWNGRSRGSRFVRDCCREKCKAGVEVIIDKERQIMQNIIR